MGREVPGYVGWLLDGCGYLTSTLLPQITNPPIYLPMYLGMMKCKAV